MRLKLEEFPLDDEAIGLPVVVTNGAQAGKTGRIDALPTDPRSTLVLVEIDPHGTKLWFDVADLEERLNTSLYADRPEVLDALGRLAESVMRKARREIEHTVGRTKRGTVDVSYNHRTRLYEVTTHGGGWTARGRAADTKYDLINLFDVQEVLGEGAEQRGRKAA